MVNMLYWRCSERIRIFDLDREIVLPAAVGVPERTPVLERDKAGRKKSGVVWYI